MVVTRGWNGLFRRKPNVEELKARYDLDGLIKALKHKDYDIGGRPSH